MTVLSARQISLSELMAGTVLTGVIATVDTQLIGWPWQFVLAHVLSNAFVTAAVFRSVMKGRKDTQVGRLYALVVLIVLFSLLMGSAAQMVFMAVSKTTHVRRAAVVLSYSDVSKYQGESSEGLRAAGRSVLKALEPELIRGGFKRYEGASGPEYVLALSKRSSIMVRVDEVPQWYMLSNLHRRSVVVSVYCKSTGLSGERWAASSTSNQWLMRVIEWAMAHLDQYPDPDLKKESSNTYHFVE